MSASFVRFAIRFVDVISNNRLKQFVKETVGSTQLELRVAIGYTFNLAYADIQCQHFPN